MNALRIALLSLTCGFVPPASAAMICVTNTAQLQQAADIAGENGQDDELRLEAASFAPPSPNVQAALLYWPADSDLDTSLKISGGWKVGTNCSEQTPNATLTLLNLQGKVGMRFQVDPPRQFLGSVTIENLYLVDSGSAGGWGYARALSWKVNAGNSARFLADRLVILYSDDSWSGAVWMQQTGGGTMSLRNSVIAHHASHQGGIEFPAVDIQALDGAHGFLINNSIHDNVGVGEVAGVNVAGKVDLYNNIIANNTATSLVHYELNAEAGSEVSLVSNHIETRNLPQPPLTDIDNTAGAADWSMAGDYRILSTGSTLRDSGFNDPPGGLPATDVFGNPRAADREVDKGALEAKGNIMFRDGFES